MAETEAKRKKKKHQKKIYPAINKVGFFVSFVWFPCFLVGPKDITGEGQGRYGSLASVPQVVRAKNERILDHDMAVSQWHQKKNQ